uniref:DDE Tnp4 domain-containing protein n=1 Tax=Hordeum vulgare subsp. vulgare TaxID=112509 RepID=A0A8I7BJ13_HORVV
MYFRNLYHPLVSHIVTITCLMQNCIGAIDGTHVPMTIASNEAAPYRNRKGTLSQNVMVACDFDLNFVYVSAGWEGSASDAGVLKSAIQSGFHVPPGKYYLVDGG